MLTGTVRCSAGRLGNAGRDVRIYFCMLLLLSKIEVNKQHQTVTSDARERNRTRRNFDKRWRKAASYSGAVFSPRSSK